MNKLQKEKVTDFKHFTKEKIMPIAKEYLNKTISLHPQTEEISNVHAKYMEAVQLTYEVLSSHYKVMFSPVFSLILNISTLTS